jgi:RHS repeat-associated protein
VDGAIGTDAQQSLLGYQSQPTDPTTGLTDMGTRLYDPSMGRFTQRDTIYGDPSSPLTLNQYAYGNDSPLTYTDQTGMYADTSGCTTTKCYETIMAGSASGIVSSQGGDPSKCAVCQTGQAPPGLVFNPPPKAAPAAPTPPGPTAWDPQNPTAKFYPTSRPHFSFLGEWKPGYACQIAPAARGFGAHCGSDGAFEDSWQKDVGLSAVIAAPFLGAIALDALTASAGDAGLSWAEQSGILRAAARGKGNFGVGSSTVDDANALGRAWVGDDFTVASDGRTLISETGLRQYRPPSFKPNLGRFQANLEQRFEGQISNAWQSNAHLDILDP